VIEKLFHSLGHTYKEDPILFHSGKELIKQASNLRPDVESFVSKIRGDNNELWILVHAIGAGEIWGPNRNGDLTLENALNTPPLQWTGNPELDRAISVKHPFGWPTYYNAHVYAHHVNKDPKRKIGDVAFVSWDPTMKRVELVLRLYRDLADKFGGSWAIKRMDRGDPIDVSMGMRVPFDLSEVETDWPKYYTALKTYDPAIHKSPGQAVLMYHRRDPIHGLAITRKDYTDLVRHRMGEILPDGQKVCVRNTFPRFFDISVVIVGAERPAKLLWKMASKCEVDGVKCAGRCKKGDCDHRRPPSGALVYERAQKMNKTAGDKKSSFAKRSDIDKKTPSDFNPKAVAGVTDAEEKLPQTLLDAMSRRTAQEALSTSALMGIKLKPEEFQHVILKIMGKGDLADDLNRKGVVFEPTEEEIKTPDISHDDFSPALAKMLKAFLPMRSGYEPFVKIRVIKIVKKPKAELQESSDPLLQKVSAAYNDYCKNLKRNFIKESALAIHQNGELQQELMKATGLQKTAAVIGPYAEAYLGLTAS